MAVRASFFVETSVYIEGNAGLTMWPVLTVIGLVVHPSFGIMTPTFDVIADATMTRPPIL